MTNKTIFSFPGLGIDWYALNKVAFSLGKIEVRWYGVLITCGIILAFLYTYLRGKYHEGVILDDIIDVGLLTVILGIVGARTYYVLTTLNTHRYDSLWDVIAIWEGGIAIYGAIIGGCIGILIMCRIKRISWLKMFDMVAPGVMLAQAIGRWGNFFNGEAYGYSIGNTTLFDFFGTTHILQSGEGTLFHTLRMGLHNGVFPTYYHPTFLYECIWNLLGFALINLFYKHKKFHGQVALLYFTWYGFGRMFIEGFRTDSLYLPGTTLRISQCLGLFCFVVGLALSVVFAILKRNAPSPLAAAATADAGASHEDATAFEEDAEEDLEEDATEDPDAPDEADTAEEAEDVTEETEGSEKAQNDTDLEDEKNGTVD